MKVYIHHEPAPSLIQEGKAFAHSIIKKLNADETVGEIIDTFAKDYNSKLAKSHANCIQLNPLALELKTEDREVLKPLTKKSMVLLQRRMIYLLL